VGDTIVRRFRPAEAQGLLTATPPQALYTLLTGPRAEIGIPELTRIFLDRSGAPVKVVDAMGSTTTLTRADARFPGLVTAVDYANGRRMTAVYDARGNLAASTDRTPGGDGIFPTTSYEWDPYWDAPTRVTLPEGEFTLTSYDAYGRPAWVQPGPDSTRRTTFAYYANGHATAPGLIQSVKSPLVNAETYAYDARGNLDTVTAPTGLQTLTMADVIGRVDSVTSPGGAKRRLTYDAADQVIEEESYGPQRTAHSSFTADSLYSAEHVWVHTYRNASGQPDSIARWQSPDLTAVGRIVTHWRYDGAGRKVLEIAPDSTPATLADNSRDSTVYNLAGNPVDVLTRRGFHITMRYDTLGRLTRRITPADTLSIDPTSVTWMSPAAVYFPYFGQDAAGNFTGGTASQTRTVVIPADTATFGYDPMGSMLWANNRDARVSRAWNANGTLASETQRIRTYARAGARHHPLCVRPGHGRARHRHRSGKLRLRVRRGRSHPPAHPREHARDLRLRSGRPDVQPARLERQPAGAPRRYHLRPGHR
jgi:YD repeat-containing protein